MDERFADETRELSTPLLHYTYDTASEHIEKVNRTTSLRALHAVEHGPWNRNTLPFLYGKALATSLFLLFKERAILDGSRGLFFAGVALLDQITVHAKIQDIKQLQREHPSDWKTIWLGEEC